MKRVAIFTAGSRGDIQPCLVLGQGLQRAGLAVSIAAPQNFAGMVEQYGLPLHPLRGDVQAIMSGETGRKFMESGGANPIRSIIAMRKMIGPVVRQMAEDTLEACRRSDALISLAVFAPFAKTFAEICNLPLILVEPTPLLPTRAFPAPGWPVQRNLGGWLNRLSGQAMLQVIWRWYGPYVNAFRQDFGLGPLKGADFQRILRSSPLIGAYSPTVIPPPVDWPKKAHVSGYWFQESGRHWHPLDELEAFLARGEAPVYVGFGSMAGRDPERFARIVLDGLAQSGRRGVLATGWGGLDVMRVPESVFVIGAAPHDWLFPRMAAVVHHGGAGTTAEGLRAGVPTAIVPFIVDQRWWGRRVWALGAGPEPIPSKRLTAAKLAEAIHQMTTDANMQQRAVRIGQTIRAEDGLGNAVTLVKQVLGV